MKGAVAAVAVLVMVVPSLGQLYRPPKGSPDEVLDQYFKMINDGVLLTPEGWKDAERLFVHPSPVRRDGTILVTTKYPLGNGPMSVNGNKAEAWQKWVDDIGTIDSEFRYHPPPKGDVEVEGTIRIFRLLFTDEHWETAADGKEKVVSGPPKWRIEGSLAARAASREAAIRYLTEMRDKTADPAMKHNADTAIAILKRLPAPRGHI